MSTPVEGLRIAQATPNDVERLVPLFDAYRQFYRRPSDVGGSRKYLTQRLERGESVIFIAEAGSRALGFTQLYPTFASLSMKPWWILYDLFVVPEVRRHGIAALLMRRAKQLAQETGAEGLSLETARDNPAQKLYEGLGWVRDDLFLHYEAYV